MYLMSYDQIKRIFQKNNPNKNLNTFQLVSSAILSGVISSLFTHPFFLIKTRLQLNYEMKSGLIGAYKSLVKTQGYKALYVGYIPTLWLTSHGAIQFLMYDKLKYYFENNNKEIVNYHLNASSHRIPFFSGPCLNFSQR
jgi:solute carrier family 25 (mitochondrial folate transporter), member 32